MVQQPRIIAKLQAYVDANVGDRGERDVFEMDDISRMDYVRWVWKETLRLHTANVGIIRVTTEDMVLKESGIRVKKGTKMMAFPYVMHRDEQLWPRSNDFWPERWEVIPGGENICHAPRESGTVRVCSLLNSKVP